MMIANVPVVWLGARFAERIPLGAARVTAALLFLGLGLWNLFGLLHMTGNS
jgi:putative Ca2+/H+ antiporter (TMEM165/GDT1 family)